MECLFPTEAGEFGDSRIDRLASLLLNRMQEKMCVCIRKLAGSRKLEVAFNRLLKNIKFSIDRMMKAAIEKAQDAVMGTEHALVIQDTTEFAFESEWKRSRRGLGRITHDYEFGFFCHPSIVVDAQSGALLGLADVCFWTRGEERTTKDEQYKKLPIEQKESMRWITAAQNSKKALNNTPIITIVADRESDIYEEFDRIPDQKTHLLTRSRSDRLLLGGGSLYNTLENLTAQGLYDLDLPAITGKRAKRTAHIEVRFIQAKIRRPKNCTDRAAADSVDQYAVEAKEVSKIAEDQEQIHWRILTTHEVKTLASARQVIGWYTQRWIIEQLFRTTKKQGLNVESSQTETAESLIKIAMLALVTSIQALQLVQARKQEVKRPFTDVFEEEDLDLLIALSNKCEGKTEKQKNPHSPQTLSWSAWIIARLGGWMGYARERPPGPITMKNGLHSFYSIKKGWQLSQVNVCIP